LTDASIIATWNRLSQAGLTLEQVILGTVRECSAEVCDCGHPRAHHLAVGRCSHVRCDCKEGQ